MLLSPHDEMSDIFSSLSDPTRRQILERLATRPHTVTEIAKPYKMSMPAISKHLKVLEKAKLIKRTKQGREHTIFLQPQTLKTVEEYISFYRRFWNTQFDYLERFLASSSSVIPAQAGIQGIKNLNKKGGETHGR